MPSYEQTNGGEDDGLEFPDWSGMVDNSATVSPATAFRMIEEIRARHPELAARWDKQRSQPCNVEFIL